MKIKIVIPVKTTMWTEPVKEAYNEYKSEETELDFVSLKKGPRSIEQAYDVAWSALPTIKEVEKAEAEGYDGVIIYCFNDPGLIAAKEAVDIPVMGINEASTHMARLLGRKFSIVGVGGKNRWGTKLDRASTYGLRDSLVSVRSTSVKVLDIKRDMEKLKDALLSEANKAVSKDGADVIVLGCGGLLGLAKGIEEELGVPVIDPGLTALKVIEGLVKLDLTQSKKAFPVPEEKERTS